VEQSEKNDNAQLAREVEFSLPRELSTDVNIDLAREFVQKTFVDKGMCADLCFHDKGDGNPHVHVLLTMRPFNEDGTWAVKSQKEYILDEHGERIRLPSGEYKSRKVSAVDWNEHSKADEWRKDWEDYQNAALERHGIDARVDHRSYARQGIDKVPGVHLGPVAAQLERKGIRTDRGDINRAVEVTNSKLSQQRARIKKAKDWLYSVPLQNAPSMVDMMTHVADGRNLMSHAKRIKNIKTMAKVLMFMQDNGIHENDFDKFIAKVEQMYERHYEIANAIKEKSRRIGTLTTHLEQYEIHQRTKAVNKKLQQLDPKKRDAYSEKHAEEIRLYKESAEYFKGVMNGRTELPIKKWKAELETLTAEKYALCDEYYKLDDELRSVEALKRGAENIMRDEPQMTEPTRKRDMTL
jgi:hypothetical protein